MNIQRTERLEACGLRTTATATLAVTLGLATGSTCSAQEFRVNVQSSDQPHGPIPGAIVKVRDERGVVQARRLADGDGRVIVRLAAGVYLVRVDAIGHRGISVQATLLPAETTKVDARLDPEPFALPAIEVRSTRPVLCEMRDGEVESVTQLYFGEGSNVFTATAPLFDLARCRRAEHRSLPGAIRPLCRRS